MTSNLNMNFSSLPLNLKSNNDVSHLYCRAVCGVSVLYCVLRPKTKDNS